MSKRKRKIDDKQLEFDFVFPKKVDIFIQKKEEILEVMDQGPKRPRNMVENEFELSVVIAAGIKKAISKSGLSRPQIVDAINAYFGRTKEGAHLDEPTCRNPLTIHRFNNFLSKPYDNPIPAYYLFPIHHVTKDLEPIRVIAELEGAQIATSEDLRHMALGKLEEHLVEIKQLKKQLKQGGGNRDLKR